MKKMITLVMAAALLVTTSAFASGGGGEAVSQQVKEAFSKDFAGAEQVNWETKDHFHYAEFKLNNIRFSAAYNEEGERVATSRSLRTEMLPLALSQALGSRYAGYSIAKTATEVTFEGETSYYLAIANDKKILYLKASPNGEISVEKKIRR